MAPLQKDYAEVYEPDGLDVEFVRGSGRTQVLIELTTQDVRRFATRI